MNAWEPRPIPAMTPEIAPYWRSAADGKLLLQECRFCDLSFAYPRAHCPDCLGTDVEWIEASGQGKIYTYSISDRVEGWPQEHLPVVLAYVDLNEGPRLLSNIVDCEPSEVDIGMTVEAIFVPSKQEGIGIPVFVPESS